MRKGRIFFVLTALSGILALWPIRTEAAMSLKLSHSFAADSLEDKGTHVFAQQVAEQTKGEIKIQVFPANQIGNIPATLQGLTLGTIDFNFVDPVTLGRLKGHEEFYIAWVPYLFNSQADCRRIYNSEVFAPLFEKVRKEKGIRTLAASGDRAPRALNTIKGPIFRPEDCKGIKLRVVPFDLAIKTAEAWGCKSTPVDFAELYMALKQGIVEGQDNGLDATVPFKFHEVAKYFAFTNHVYSLFGWYVSEKTWNKIPTQFRSTLGKAARTAGDFLTKEGAQREQNDLDTMLKSGVKVTIPDRFAFQEAVKDIHKEFEGNLWPKGMVDKIRAMQKK